MSPCPQSWMSLYSQFGGTGKSGTGKGVRQGRVGGSTVARCCGEQNLFYLVVIQALFTNRPNPSLCQESPKMVPETFFGHCEKHMRGTGQTRHGTRHGTGHGQTRLIIQRHIIVSDGKRVSQGKNTPTPNRAEPGKTGHGTGQVF